MSSLRQIITGILIGGGTWLGLCGSVMAQRSIIGDNSQVAASSPDGWQQRVLRRGPGRYPRVEAVSRPQDRSPRWSPQRQAPLRTASAQVPVAEPEFDLGTGQEPFNPLPPDVGGGAVTMEEPGLTPHMPGCSDCVDWGERHDGCGACGECYEGCGGHGDACGGCCGGYGHWGSCGLGLCGIPAAIWMRDLSLFAGVHGFKGPPDLGRNGNFGLHEGVNYGSALGGPLAIGYQAGIAAVHSNFSGDQADQSSGTDNQLETRRGDRDQIFFTAGLFRRALCGGFQGGIAFDLLHDVYYDRADLKQIRTELGYVFHGGRREIGYFGAYGTGDDSFRLLDNSLIGLDPTDMFAFYYRRYFHAGGEGRLWAGFSGNGDGLLGGDIRLPIGSSWALENQANYLIPKQARGAAGQPEESWGVTIQLVWYPGRAARCVDQSPFRPLFNVADNTTFMSDLVPD